MNCRCRWSPKRQGRKPRAQSALEPNQLANRLNFSVSVGLSIGLGQVLKPGLRNRRVRMIPRVPGQVSLGLPGHQTPIDCTYVVALRNWQDSVNGAAERPGQVLGAEDRPPQWGQFGDPSLKCCWFVIAVECDHVGVVQLNVSDCAAVLRISPLAVPHTTH